MKAHCIYVFVISAFLLMPVQKLMATVVPGDNFFEIDGDYGSLLQDFEGGDGIDDVRDGDGGDLHTTYGRLENSGQEWVHSTSDGLYPYMGLKMYRAQCNPTPAGCDKDRSEQMLLADWYSANGKRYISFAFYIPTNASTPTNWLMLAQWHQDDPHKPPLYLSWEGSESVFKLSRRYDCIENGQYVPEKYGLLWTSTDNGFYVEKGKWYCFLAAVKPGLNNTGSVQLQKMNPATGQWELMYNNDAITIGYQYQADGETPANQEFQWKLGTYRGNQSVTTKIYFDNIRYGRTWNFVTKNKLTGYHKAVLDLRFDEAAPSGNNVWDQCYLFNSGSQNDPLYDYNNDGTLYGATRMSGGVRGGTDKCLYFDNTDYVSVPLDTVNVDFDFGNYTTFSCWFAASADQTGKALVSQDLYSSTGSDNWKVRLYFNAANKIDFCVRHPDNTTSYVRATGASSYCNGYWHHVVGTYNRFDTGGRLRIYVDGVLANSATGADKPVLKGTIPLYIGKIFSGSYYNGYIDEVMVFNYALTSSEVSNLYNSY